MDSQPQPSAPDEGRELVEQCSALVNRACALQIVDATSHAAAQELWAACKDMDRKIVDFFAPMKEAAHKAHAAVCAREKQSRAVPLRGMELAQLKIRPYEAEQRRLEDEARRKAEAEALRQLEEQRLAEAIAAEEAGDTATAEAILDEPAPPVVPVVEVPTQRATVAGIGSRGVWRARVTDLAALVKHVAEHPELINTIEANMPALNALARAQREAMRLPGVVAYEERSMTRRSPAEDVPKW